MRTAWLLLAAGAGSRFGRPKALVRVGGQTLAQRGVHVLRRGGCDPVVVAAGAAAVAIQGASVVEVPDWEAGMAASLRSGLGALGRPGVDAVVVALADQPGVTGEVVAQLIVSAGVGTAAVVACYGGKPRNPVLLHRSVWDDVIALSGGDTGARAWLRAHPERVTRVECGHLGSAEDIDTPGDLAQFVGRG